MTDTNLPHSSDMVPRKLLVRNKHGHPVYEENTRICDICSYGDNKTCAKCIFNAANMLGLRAAFSPKDAYREAHKDDISASPLMQEIAKRKTRMEQGYPNWNVLPDVKLPHFPVKSAQSLIDGLRKIQGVRKAVA